MNRSGEVENMRIVHVMDYFQPQLGYQETFLAREHAKMGHEVLVVTSDRYDPLLFPANKGVLGSRIKSAGFFVEEGINVWRLKTLFEIPFEIWMRGLEKKIQELEPDLVIVHRIVKFESIRIARLKKRLGNFKLIYDDHMSFDNSSSILRFLYPVFRLAFAHAIYNNADGLVGVADASRDFMIKRYGFPPDRITVIPLGADHELFRFDEVARQQIRSQFSLNQNDVVFVYSGKIVPQKSLNILIEAVKLMKNHNNLRVLLVGDGPSTYVEKMKLAIRDAVLVDKFIWHNVVPNRELYRLYSAADVGVWPRGASIGQREAMACGLPIIISADSMVTELLDYDNGLICQEENPSDLAKQMERLLDAELRRKMGQNSRKLVEETLSWKIIAKQFIDLVS